MQENRVVFSLGETVEFAAPAPISVVLSIFKFDRFEWAIEKLTELAVREIYPVVAARTDTRLAAAADKRAERWRRIALEASQQSRRSGPPLIHDPVPLKSMVVPRPGHKLVLAETEQLLSFQGALDSLPKLETGEKLLPILWQLDQKADGPKRNWTFSKGQQWQRVSLGRAILRARTAAIAGVAVIGAKLSG